MTARPHAEIATRFFADNKLHCWEWDSFFTEWLRVYRPKFAGDKFYALGDKPTSSPVKPRKTCTLGGLTFPEPETVAPGIGTECWFADGHRVLRMAWNSMKHANDVLISGRIHLTEKSAQQHFDAREAANAQAIAGAV